MGSVVLRDCRCYIGGIDCSGRTNRAELDLNIEEEDVSCFDSGGWRELLPGGSKGDLSYTVLEDSAEMEATLGVEAPASLIVSNEEGAVGYFGSMAPLKAARKLNVGKAYIVECSGPASGPIIRGKVSAIGSKDSGGEGMVLDLGGVAAGKGLHAALHVLAISGGTLAVKVQGSATEGFSSPADLITFSPATAQGAQIISMDGPISDGYFRASWTLSAGTARMAVIIGIR
jgi:hypothetical protein